jgi:hypothetical protein
MDLRDYSRQRSILDGQLVAMDQAGVTGLSNPGVVLAKNESLANRSLRLWSP